MISQQNQVMRSDLGRGRYLAQPDFGETWDRAASPK